MPSVAALASSSSCVPFSTMRPPLTTTIMSAFLIVESLCAITIVVRFCFVMISSSAAWTTFSDLLSSADVASSSSKIAGFLMSARAIAMRCFCPPDSLLPPWPTCVAYPSLRFALMNSCALAMVAASSISSFVASPVSLP
mmetsp:Transcript_19555/g.55444  ORF Transcript_19555/g.55444 Transcript_19555/m.55444 type:complete len:140 (+) Transcript_19555:169-588(+)